MCGYARHRNLRRAYLHTPGWGCPPLWPVATGLSGMPAPLTANGASQAVGG